MKQLYPTLLAFVACMSQTSFANAETTDINYPEAEQRMIFCDYWTNFSKDTYTLESGGDKALHFQFYNYTVGVNNWQNWALCGVSDQNNVHDNGENKQLFVLRCDNWENVGGLGNQGTKENDFNWDTFRKDMDGSFVDMTVKYDKSAGTFTMTSTITTADDKKKYKYNWEKAIDSKPDKLYLYFACENSYISKEKAAEWKATKTYYPESTNKVTTGGYWTNPSTEDYVIEPGQKLNFQFYNYSSKADIWNNWLLCGIKDRTQKGDGKYCEFIKRVDNYDIKAEEKHWGDHCTNNYGKLENSEILSAVKENMDGALVNMDVMYYTSGRLGVKATFTKGTTSYDYSYYKDFTDAEKPNLYLFFQGEYSYIDAPKSEVTVSSEMVYATYSNPTFSVDFTDSGATAYIITSSDGTNLTFKEVKAVPANTGVLLVGTMDAKLTIKAANGELDDVTGNLLVADDGTKQATANSYILAKPTNGVPGFYKSKEKRTFTAGKAHLELSPSTVSTTCEAFALDELGILTGIAGVQATVDAEDDSSADYFNTAGQKVGASYKGIVIRDGMKMIRK